MSDYDEYDDDFEDEEDFQSTRGSKRSPAKKKGQRRPPRDVDSATSSVYERELSGKYLIYKAVTNYHAGIWSTRRPGAVSAQRHPHQYLSRLHSAILFMLTCNPDDVITFFRHKRQSVVRQPREVEPGAK